LQITSKLNRIVHLYTITFNSVFCDGFFLIFIVNFKVFFEMLIQVRFQIKNK